MTPENVKLLIDTLGAIATLGIIMGFSIWLVKYFNEEDRGDD